MVALAAQQPAGQRFDAVVVDEAQDFADSWWPALLAALKDDETGGVYVFGDEGQRVFARQGRPPVALVPIALDENMRNTVEIAKTFGPLATTRMRCRGGDGPPVRFLACEDEDALATADDEVDALLDEGWPMSSVALLTTGPRHPEHRARQEVSQDSYWDSFWDDDQVFYGHVLGFKGLERPVVVLALNGFSNDGRTPREALRRSVPRPRPARGLRRPRPDPRGGRRRRTAPAHRGRRVTAVAQADVERTAGEVIAALAGPDATVRPDQLDAVRALVVDRRRCLVVQATGWGKSAVYWIAARALRDAGAGPVLVVSPLLALMRDQVAAAERAGLRAVSLNSSNFAEWTALEAEVLAGDVDVLLVSPERLANPRFTSDVLRHLLPRLGMLVIDEAHCISSWGHDFRPDYQRLARLLVARPDLPVLATTATANRRVSADVAAQLGDSTYVLRGQLARDSLHLSVVPGLSPLERYAWVDAALGVLPGSGIVYALTVAEAERLAGFLRERGHDVAAYTGGTDPDVRLALEKRLLRNEVKALVATSALGMGYDKPDLAFCVHMGSPSSPVDYYQQVGRAGRALESALVVLLPGHDDERLWEWFATASIPDPAQAEAVLGALRDAGEGVATSVPALEAATGVRRGRVELLVKVLAVDGAVERVSDGWAATGHDWSYDAELYDGIKTARRAEAEIMRGYTHGRGCLEAYLRTALDDEVPEGYRCGRCSVCTGSLPGGLPSRPSDDGVLAAKAYLRGIDTVIEPRKMWAPGMTRWAGPDPCRAAGRGRAGGGVRRRPCVVRARRAAGRDGARRRAAAVAARRDRGRA